MTILLFDFLHFAATDVPRSLLEFHAGRGHRVRSIVGGIALALLIGGCLFLRAVLNG